MAVERQRSYRESLGSLLRTRPAALAELIIVACLVYFRWLEPYGTLLVGWASLWLRGKNWDDVGLRNPKSWRRVVALAAVSVVVLLVGGSLLTIGLEQVTGVPINQDIFEVFKGNPFALYALLALVWSSAGFGEEMAYRGYLVNRLQDILGGTGTGLKVVSVLLMGAFFGFPHIYYGITGAIEAGLMGVLFGALYLYGSNLWLPILAHGTYDTVATLLNYFS